MLLFCTGPPSSPPLCLSWGGAAPHRGPGSWSGWGGMYLSTLTVTSPLDHGSCTEMVSQPMHGPPGSCSTSVSQAVVPSLPGSRDALCFPERWPWLGQVWLLYVASGLHTLFPLLLCLLDSYISFKGQVKWLLLRKAFPFPPKDIITPFLGSLTALRSTTYRLSDPRKVS